MPGFISFPIFLQQLLYTSAFVISITFIHISSAYAASPEYLVSPARPGALAYSPYYLSVLTSTELDVSGIPINKRTAVASVGRTTIGADAFLSDGLQILNIPVTTTIYHDLHAQLDLPLISRSVDSTVGAKTETGIGDITLTLKLRMDLAETTEIFYLFSARLPSGDEEKGLGKGGTYDLTVAEKLVTWFGDYRSTFMAGVSVPMVHATVSGHDIKQNPTVTCMAAAERSFIRPELWFGLKAAGQHIFNSRIDGIRQPNGLTTLDIIPEANYYLANGLKLRAALLLPIYTNYALPGAENSRGAVVNLGMAFSF